MFASVIQQLVRFGGGLGLLLLLAVQQKVCTWPAVRAVDKDAAAADAARCDATPCDAAADEERTSTDDSSGSPPQREPLTVTSTLPDVAPPRGSAPQRPVLVARGKPRHPSADPASISAGLGRRANDVPGDLSSLSPRRLRADSSSIGYVAPLGPEIRPEPLFSTAILATGPPRA